MHRPIPTYADSTWLVESVDQQISKVIIATEGLYDLSDETAGANISQLAITGFNLIDKSNLHGETYTISNVTSTTFTVNDSTVDANVDVQIYLHITEKQKLQHL